jgi:glycosyltransferase 2 family protein
MKRWQFWVGILISIAFLVWGVSKLHLADVWTALKSANYIWLVPGVAVWFVGLFVRTWRWHYLLRPLKKISTWKMFPVVAIGYMGNNIYPARAGEVLRAYVLRKREGVPISASLATIIVERIFDGVVMLAFVFLNLGQLTNLTQQSGFLGDIRTLAIIGAAVFIGALVVFLLAAMFPRNAERITRWLVVRLLPARLREKTLSIAFKFLDGLESLRNPQTALMIFLTSVVIWLFETLKYWFVTHAFPGLEVSFFALMLMNGIVNLATTLPSAPGYIGTFDAPGIAVLTAYGVGVELATAYTLVLHAALWFPITILGAYYFSREGLKWTANYRGEVDAERNPTPTIPEGTEKKLS